MLTIGDRCSPSFFRPVRPNSVLGCCTVARFDGDVEGRTGGLSEGFDGHVEIDVGSRPRAGRAAVVEFFQAISGIEFRTSRGKMMLANGDVVVTLIDLACVVKATGIAIEQESDVRIWHFDDNGKVTRFCHMLDSHQHWAAHEDIDLRQAASTP